jgi:hypothetical protein
MKKKAKRKPVKRKDGQPTRSEKSAVNKAAYKAAQEALARYVPPSAQNQMQAIIDEMKAGGELKTDVEKQQAILSLIVAGLPLRRAREVVGVPHMHWHRWLKASDELKNEYTLAKEERTEAWADDIHEDAMSANAFNVQAVRLRIETKKWLMAKQSGRYADKTVIAGDPTAPLHHIHSAMTAQEAQEHYRRAKEFTIPMLGGPKK